MSASQDSASATQGSDSPTLDTSQWQCPRCRQPGVNVWHGCTRRSATSAVNPTQTTAPPSVPQSTQCVPASPQAASLPVSIASSVPSEVASLKAAVASMTSQFSSYTARFEAIEHRMVELCSLQAEMHTKISVTMEAQQALTVTDINLAEKIDFLATHLEMVTALSSSSSSSSGVQQSTDSCSRLPIVFVWPL